MTLLEVTAAPYVWEAEATGNAGMITRLKIKMAAKMVECKIDDHGTGTVTLQQSDTPCSA